MTVRTRARETAAPGSISGKLFTSHRRSSRCICNTQAYITVVEFICVCVCVYRCIAGFVLRDQIDLPASLIVLPPSQWPSSSPPAATHVPSTTVSLPPRDIVTSPSRDDTTAILRSILRCSDKLQTFHDAQYHSFIWPLRPIIITNARL